MLNNSTIDQFVKLIKREITGTIFENKVYIVGGCCRDFLLEKSITDIDVVVNLPNGGIDLANFLYEKKLLLTAPTIYETYGTVKFKLSTGIEVEAVYTRSEEYVERYKRNPKVKFGTLEEDAKRRDFTINAIYFNISGLSYYDPLNGKSDIQAGIIKTTDDPNIIFNEDPLRILRAVRFATTLKGFEIEETTLEGMKKNVSRLQILPSERVAKELNDILLSEDTVKGLKILEKIGALFWIHPYFHEMVNLTQNKYHVGTVWEHTLRVLENLPSKNDYSVVRKFYGELKWAALLHDIGKITTKTVDENGKVHFINHEIESEKLSEEILRYFHFSTHTICIIKFLVREHMRFKHYKKDLSDLKRKKLRHFLYYSGINVMFVNLLVYLIDSDNISHAEGYNLEGQAQKLSELIEEEADWIYYILPINGNDIMEIKKIPQGKLIAGYKDYILSVLMSKYQHPQRISRDTIIKLLEGATLNNIKEQYKK